MDLSKRSPNDRTYFATLYANFKRYFIYLLYRMYPRVYFRGEPLFD